MKSAKVDNNYVAVIDDWYSAEEYQSVVEECKFLIQYGEPPEVSGSAFDTQTKRPLKRNSAVWIENVFRNFYLSQVGKLSHKVFDKTKDLIGIDPLYHYLNESKKHDCLISYYEDSDYYKAHRDGAVITLITWIYDEPKAFVGGDLILLDNNNNPTVEIECKNNRTVIFPSFIQHEVTNISMDKEDLNKKLGRFTISQFMAISP